MLAAGFSRFTQIEKYPRGAIDTVARNKRGSNQVQEPGILLGPIGDRMLEPFVVPAGSNAEHSAHEVHAELVAVCLDELVNLPGPTGHSLEWTWCSPSDFGLMLLTVHEKLGTPLAD